LVPDCTDPAHIDAPNGRGIMLMRNYMSRVEYNDVGNVVVMEKRRDS
jgi:serine/threonine-protein kinase RsbW